MSYIDMYVCHVLIGVRVPVSTSTRYQFYFPYTLYSSVHLISALQLQPSVFSLQKSEALLTLIFLPLPLPLLGTPSPVFVAINIHKRATVLSA